jgi:hypothetical protein
MLACEVLFTVAYRLTMLEIYSFDKLRCNYIWFEV